MDPLWIIAAFIFGTVVAKLGLPPLAGYLIAGFVLNSLGIEGGRTLSDIANAGVTLLLFTIGLKLKARSESICLFTGPSTSVSRELA